MNASSANNKPYRLQTSFREKIWGSTRLAPWYPDSQVKIGEVWFEAQLPLLIKFIFTTDKLSVQVHPNDRYAGAHENSRGKTEMWHILRADPGAQIALGFRNPITRQRLREASLSGEIMDLLRWVDVNPGETYFVPAGTVHAIGAGIALCEVQQYSDVTYRLHDYGRDRELHLDKAAEVSDTAAHDGKLVPLPLNCAYFHTDLQTLSGTVDYQTDPDRFQVLTVLEGAGRMAGQPYRLGEAWFVPAGIPAFSIEAEQGTKLLRTWVP